MLAAAWEGVACETKSRMLPIHKLDPQCKSYKAVLGPAVTSSDQHSRVKCWPYGQPLLDLVGWSSDGLTIEVYIYYGGTINVSFINVYHGHIVPPERSVVENNGVGVWAYGSYFVKSQG
jgi:hypothetical protein